MLEQILENLPDHEFVIIEGHDAAVIGVAEDSAGLHLLYSLSKVYAILIEDHRCESHDDCSEWYYHNMMSLSNLENGPIFMEDMILG